MWLQTASPILTLYFTNGHFIFDLQWGKYELFSNTWEISIAEKTLLDYQKTHRILPNLLLLLLTDYKDLRTVLPFIRFWIFNQKSFTQETQPHKLIFCHNCFYFFVYGTRYFYTHFTRAKYARTRKVLPNFNHTNLFCHCCCFLYIEHATLHAFYARKIRTLFISFHL